jgi:hypothetical protein
MMTTLSDKKYTQSLLNLLQNIHVVLTGVEGLGLTLFA